MASILEWLSWGRSEGCIATVSTTTTQRARLGGGNEQERRMKNRETAWKLARDNAPPCPECGQKGPHWVGMPMTLGYLLSGMEPEGFWLCDKFYGPDGKRLPTNE